jgi:hypothetical protein
VGKHFRFIVNSIVGSDNALLEIRMDDHIYA